ncbi:hypothetical protein K9N50_07645 [bacterium]|nr:hypothetical protein [bacterium]
MSETTKNWWIRSFAALLAGIGFYIMLGYFVGIDRFYVCAVLILGVTIGWIQGRYGPKPRPPKDTGKLTSIS